MTNLKNHNRALETTSRVGLKVSESISDSPFLNKNMENPYSNYYEFSEEIENEIIEHLKLWKIDLEEVEFMSIG